VALQLEAFMLRMPGAQLRAPPSGASGEAAGFKLVPPFHFRRMRSCSHSHAQLAVDTAPRHLRTHTHHHIMGCPRITLTQQRTMHLT